MEMVSQPRSHLRHGCKPTEILNNKEECRAQYQALMSRDLSPQTACPQASNHRRPLALSSKGVPKSGACHPSMASPHQAQQPLLLLPGRSRLSLQQPARPGNPTKRHKKPNADRTRLRARPGVHHSDCTAALPSTNLAASHCYLPFFTLFCLPLSTTVSLNSLSTSSLSEAWPLSPLPPLFFFRPPLPLELRPSITFTPSCPRKSPPSMT